MSMRAKLAATALTIVMVFVVAGIIYAATSQTTRHAYRAKQLDERAGFMPYATLQNTANWTALGVSIDVNGTAIKCPRLDITDRNLANVFGMTSTASLYTTGNASFVMWGSMVGYAGSWGIVFRVNGFWYMENGVSNATVQAMVAVAVEL